MEHFMAHWNIVPVGQFRCKGKIGHIKRLKIKNFGTNKQIIHQIQLTCFEKEPKPFSNSSRLISVLFFCLKAEWKLPNPPHIQYLVIQISGSLNHISFFIYLLVLCTSLLRSNHRSGLCCSFAALLCHMTRFQPSLKAHLRLIYASASKLQVPQVEVSPAWRAPLSKCNCVSWRIDLFFLFEFSSTISSSLSSRVER